MKQVDCNGNCNPSVMSYDSTCPIHGWIEESNQIILIQIQEQDLLIGYEYLCEFDDQGHSFFRKIIWRTDFYKIKKAYKWIQK